MPAIESCKQTETFIGTGSDKSVCLLLIHGIGDSIHAMPVVRQMVLDGYDVTIYVHPFQVPLWQHIGCTVYPAKREVLNMNFLYENKNKFTRILSLSSWVTWAENDWGMKQAPMDYFAYLLDAKLPDSFRWLDYIHPAPSEDEPCVVFAPESNEVWRTVPEMKAREIYAGLVAKHGKVLWLTASKTRTIDSKVLLSSLEEQFGGQVLYVDPTLINAPEKVYCDSIMGVARILKNATLVISAESGMLNLATALECKTVGLFGATHPDYIIGQFKRFIPVDSESVYGKSSACQMPCYRLSERGMIMQKDGSKLCQGEHKTPQCLVQISTEQILANT